MRRLHTESSLRRAIVAIQDSDGYVDALLRLARDQVAGRGHGISRAPSPVRFHAEPRAGARERPAAR